MFLNPTSHTKGNETAKTREPHNCLAPSRLASPSHPLPEDTIFALLCVTTCLLDVIVSITSFVPLYTRWPQWLVAPGVLNSRCLRCRPRRQQPCERGIVFTELYMTLCAINRVSDSRAAAERSELAGVRRFSPIAPRALRCCWYSLRFGPLRWSFRGNPECVKFQLAGVVCEKRLNCPVTVKQRLPFECRRHDQHVKV